MKTDRYHNIAWSSSASPPRSQRLQEVSTRPLHHTQQLQQIPQRHQLQLERPRPTDQPRFAIYANDFPVVYSVDSSSSSCRVSSLPPVSAVDQIPVKLSRAGRAYSLRIGASGSDDCGSHSPPSTETLAQSTSMDVRHRAVRRLQHYLELPDSYSSCSLSGSTPLTSLRTPSVSSSSSSASLSSMTLHQQTTDSRASSNSGSPNFRRQSASARKASSPTSEVAASSHIPVKRRIVDQNHAKISGSVASLSGSAAISKTSSLATNGITSQRSSRRSSAASSAPKCDHTAHLQSTTEEKGFMAYRCGNCGLQWRFKTNDSSSSSLQKDSSNRPQSCQRRVDSVSGSTITTSELKTSDPADSALVPRTGEEREEEESRTALLSLEVEAVQPLDATAMTPEPAATFFSRTTEVEMELSTAQALHILGEQGALPWQSLSWSTLRGGAGANEVSSLTLELPLADYPYGGDKDRASAAAGSPFTADVDVDVSASTPAGEGQREAGAGDRLFPVSIAQQMEGIRSPLVSDVSLVGTTFPLSVVGSGHLCAASGLTSNECNGEL